MASITDELKSESKATAARMRHLLPEIEHALAVGHSHAQVHALLVTRGIETSFLYYQNLLHRLRKEKARGKVAYQPPQGLPAPHNTNLANQKHMGVPAEPDSDSKFKWDVKSPLKW